MPPEEIQKRLRRSPFEPFRLYLTDGASYDIRHPEMLMVGKRSLVLGLSNDPETTFYDRSIDIDILHVVRTEQIIATGPKPTNGPA